MATGVRQSWQFRKFDVLGIGAAILGAGLFSTKPVIIKLIYAHGLATETLLALRMGISLPFYLMIGWYAFHRAGAKRALPRKTILLAMANGMLGYYLASYADFLALHHITAQLERLVLFTYPFFVVILGALFFRQELQRWTFPAMITAYAGLAAIFLNTASGNHAGNIALGTGLVLIAAISFSLFQLIGKGLVQELGAPLYTSIAMSSAAVGVIVQFLVMQPLASLHVSAEIWWLVLIIALVATVIPSYLINFALGRIGADGTAMIGNVGPLVTIALAALLLGEPFGIIDALGTALVIGGMILFARR